MTFLGDKQWLFNTQKGDTPKILKKNQVNVVIEKIVKKFINYPDPDNEYYQLPLLIPVMKKRASKHFYVYAQTNSGEGIILNDVEFIKQVNDSRVSGLSHSKPI